jgi:hypothetical protein
VQHHDVTGILEYSGDCVELAESTSILASGGQLLATQRTYARAYAQLDDLCSQPTIASWCVGGACAAQMNVAHSR